MADLFTRPQFLIDKGNNYSGVHYAEACTGFGVARMAGILKDTLIIHKLSERYLKVIDEQIVNTGNHVDVNVYGILPLALYLLNRNDSIFLKQGLDLADKQWNHPLPDGLTNQTRYWIDDIWMINSLQVQAYRATGNMIYLERAALETDSYIRKLQQPNGLFFHGNISHFFWGRGNGWIAAGMAELLSELPKTNPYYHSIYQGYRKMMEGLRKYQAEDGMWRQLVDKPEAWKETSSTAMFGYAMTLGVKKGLLPKRPFAKVYQKAWLSLAEYVNSDGKVADVCVGTGQNTDIHYYLSRPRVTGDFHGQAPVLWFAYSLLLPDYGQ